MTAGEYYERGSLATCGGCGNLHISPSTGVTYCSAEECVRLIHTKDQDNQTAKADAGKLDLTLVPLQIIEDIAEVREYGNKKYHDPDNWKTVDIQRYRAALFRHFIAYLRDPQGVDKESGIPHYKHMACNMAFICEMEKKEKEEK